MLRPELFDEFKQKTMEEAPDDSVKQLLWFLWRGVAWVGLIAIVSVAVVLWFIFYVVFAAWRDPKG